MFSSGFAESSDQTVKIQDIHADLMGNIIGFLETGQISINGESVFDFLECAGMLQIESLLRKCTHYVIKNLSIENAVDVFQTSLHLSLEELFSKATQFILLHFNQLSHLTKLHKLTFKEFQYLLTHEHLPLTEHSELLTLIDQWIESDKEQRQPLRPKLCQAIETIGNVQLFDNLTFILYARWRFKIVCLQTKLASLAMRKNTLTSIDFQVQFSINVARFARRNLVSMDFELQF